jgi:DnaK suppressor protein
MPTASHLSPDELRELRAELTRELARLERSMDSITEAAKPVALDQTAVGRLSRMDSLQTQHLSADLHNRTQARHAQLLHALARLDDGTYGVCLTCTAPIPFGRLFVMPEARTCAACGSRG